MDGTGETDACRPTQTAGSTMADAESQTDGHCEEQRRSLAIGKNILHCRLPFPAVNHNAGNRDSFLCVLSLDFFVLAKKGMFHSL